MKLLKGLNVLIKNIIGMEFIECTQPKLSPVECIRCGLLFKGIWNVADDKERKEPYVHLCHKCWSELKEK